MLKRYRRKLQELKQLKAETQNLSKNNAEEDSFFYKGRLISNNGYEFDYLLKSDKYDYDKLILDLVYADIGFGTLPLINIYMRKKQILNFIYLNICLKF